MNSFNGFPIYQLLPVETIVDQFIALGFNDYLISCELGIDVSTRELFTSAVANKQIPFEAYLPLVFIKDKGLKDANIRANFRDIVKITYPPLSELCDQKIEYRAVVNSHE